MSIPTLAARAQYQVARRVARHHLQKKTKTLEPSLCLADITSEDDSPASGGSGEHDRRVACALA
jgi:hypothetical protein